MKIATTPAAATTPSRVVSHSRAASLPGGAVVVSLFLFIIIFSSSSANLVRAQQSGEDSAVAAAAVAAGLPPIWPGFGSASASRAAGRVGGGGGGGGAKVRGDDISNLVRPRPREDEAVAAAAPAAAGSSELPPILSGLGSASRVVDGGSSGSGGGVKVRGGDDTMLPLAQQQHQQQQQQQQQQGSPLTEKTTTPPTTITPQEWIALTLTFDGGATTKTVMVKEGGTEEEVQEAVTKSCREAGVTGTYEASVVTAKCMALQLGLQRTEWWFEQSGAKDVFQSFFGGMAASAESRPFFALEMGSLEGASAMWFARHLLKHPASLLVCLDTWDGGHDLEYYAIDMTSVEERFKWNMAKTPNVEKVVAMKGDSLRSLAGLVASGLTSSFDVIYVDASHQMKDVLADSLLSFRLLKVGGIMVFDDYITYPGVKQATTPLEEALGDSVEVIFRQEQLVVKKTAEDRWATRDSTPLMGDQGKLDGIVKISAAAAASAASTAAS